MGHGDDCHDEHHHHDEIPEVPDWRCYRVEDVPELCQVQKMLHQKGLHDPWLRNEVWRYHPDYKVSYPEMVSKLFRGWKYGLVAALIVTGAGMFMNAGHEHGHEHGHGEEGSGEGHH